MQEKYSPLDRGLEEDLPYTQKHNIAILAYSPLANGLLTGKIGPTRSFAPDDLRYNNPRFSQEARQQVQKMLEEIKPIAVKHQLTVGQLVLAWTCAQPGITHLLVGARDAPQARENAKAGSVALSDRELQTIDKVFQSYAPLIPAA
jgi:aryl-alcohol dehydrogenase-like predicted oxidoreductase